MREKSILQGVVLILSFLGAWVLLAMVPWTDWIPEQGQKMQLEQKLGQLIISDIEDREEFVNDTLVLKTMDSLLINISDINGIERERYKIHITRNNEVNAYSLPDHHLIFNAALIRETDSPEELSAVMAHEMAHSELNHVMRKIMGEFSIAIIVGITSGSADPGLLHQIAQLLTSAAFSRDLEKEADLQAISYLHNAGISPEHLSNFLYRLAEEEDSGSVHQQWLSTHPDLVERALYVLEERDSSALYVEKELLKPQTWNALKAFCE